jgi:restriction system protein
LGLVLLNTIGERMAAMGRRAGFVGIISAIARESARKERQAIAANKRYQRELVRQVREEERISRYMEKEEKQRYLESRMRETEAANREIGEQISDLQSILANRYEEPPSFESLKRPYSFAQFQPERIIGIRPSAPGKDAFYQNIEPSFLASLLPGASKKKQERIDAADKAYSDAMEQFESELANYIDKMNKLKSEYETKENRYQKELFEENQKVDDFKTSYSQGEPQAIIEYYNWVLDRSKYPDLCPQEFKIAYVVESNELVVDYELPTPDIVPPDKEYRYIKSKDLIETKTRKASEIKEIYTDVVASIALRTIHEIFENDQYDLILTAVFNGYIHTTDPGTGRSIAPYLISVRTTKEVFGELVLDRIDKTACLRNLGANVSPRPHELQPVKPIVEFDMVDKRFVEDANILDSIDSRPNLYDLTPSEFENLICNLFSKKGLETKLTRTSKDGGVDVVAFDLRPVIGGKVVIQAKRYKNTVGVSAVRDLYGTMMNEGANKGILVTTSGYGPDAFNFSSGKPVELIDGGQLLYLLSEIGVNARIIFPEDQA